MEAWEKKVERIENNPRRRAKESKVREYYEKQFPEIRKQRELQERMQRWDHVFLFHYRLSADLLVLLVISFMQPLPKHPHSLEWRVMFLLLKSCWAARRWTCLNCSPQWTRSLWNHRWNIRAWGKLILFSTCSFARLDDPEVWNYTWKKEHTAKLLGLKWLGFDALSITVSHQL